MPGSINTSGLEITISQDFSLIYPGASVGVLILENVTALYPVENLDDIKRETIIGLQKQFPDLKTLKEHPIIQAYTSYYKRFNKSYHVLGQMASVIFENRPLPSGSALVEAMFAAELKNMLLTAVHDLDVVKPPLEIGIASEGEIYTTLRGNEQRLKPGDMMFSDQTGAISSVIYGPDYRTKVESCTSNVLFVVYAPDGVGRETINGHFEDIKQNIRIFSPQFTTKLQGIFPKG